MATPVTDPKKLKGAWKALYDFLILHPTCKCCKKGDLKKEALAIVNGAMVAEKKLKGKSLGCIACSRQVGSDLHRSLNKLYKGSGKLKHNSAVVSGAKRAYMDWVFAKLLGKSTKRMWMKIETPCYIIENVARWSPPEWSFTNPLGYPFWYRHQAVLVYPKCYKGDPFLNPRAVVIDLFDGKPSWYSWKDWAGGMANVNKTVGRVKDKF